MADLKRLDFGLTLEQREAIERRIDENERDPRFEARRRAEQADRDAQELANLEAMLEKAMSGIYGALSKKIAQEHDQQHGRSRWALEQLRLKLSRVPGRQSG